MDGESVQDVWNEVTLKETDQNKDDVINWEVDSKDRARAQQRS